MITWMLWSVLFSLVISVAAFAAERAADRLGAARRHVWMVAMVAAAFVPPLLASRRVTVPADAPPQPIVEEQPSAAPSAVSAPAVHRSFSPPVVRSIASPVLPVRRGSAADVWALAIWALASLFLGVAFVRAMFSLRRQSREWPETDVGSYHALLAPNAGPAVVGFAHPRIVLPRWALSLDARARDLMLRHETEHIRAGDPRSLFAAGVLLVMFPWNAALWLIVRQLRRAMELDCDARVVRAVGGPSEYGRLLLAVGERYSAPLPLAASLAAPRPLLEQRIDAMTTPKPRRPLVAALPFAAIALLAMVAAARAPRPTPLAPISLHAAQAAEVRTYPPVVVTAPTTATAKPAQATPPHTSPATAAPSIETIPSIPVALAPTPASAPKVDRAMIRALVTANYPALVTGDTKATYIVMVFDSNNNFVWSTAGSGTAAINVWGDTLSNADRRALQTREREEAGEFTGGGGGRGGRRGGAPSQPPVGAAAYSTGAVTSAVPPRGRYSIGVGVVTPTPIPGLGDLAAAREAGRRAAAESNQAPGLTRPAPQTDESGIVGIPASQVMYADALTFYSGELTPSRLEVLAVHLVK